MNINKQFRRDCGIGPVGLTRLYHLLQRYHVVGFDWFNKFRNDRVSVDILALCTNDQRIAAIQDLAIRTALPIPVL